MNRHQFLWIDLETTGLNPWQCRVLEWAVVLAADDADGDMSPVHQFAGVIHWPRADVERECNDFVRDMHTRNGLIDACDASTVTLEQSDEYLVQLCQYLAGRDEPKGIVLAGASVHFDLSFVRVHFPRFAKCLSHRVFDVSTLKAAHKAWRGEIEPIKGDRHRALDDVLATLAEARQIRAATYGLGGAS